MRTINMDSETTMRPSKEAGFTLLELMIVVVIIAILSALAYFNYNKYGFRARREDGQAALTRFQAAEERYYTNYNSYAITAASLTAAPPAGLGMNGTTSEKSYYAISVAAGGSGDAQTYVLTATPVAGSAQAGDGSCTTLTIDNTGKKSQTGTQTNGSCWGK